MTTAHPISILLADDLPANLQSSVSLRLATVSPSFQLGDDP